MNKKRLFYLLLLGLTLMMVYGFIFIADFFIQQKLKNGSIPNEDSYWKAYYVNNKKSANLFDNSSLIIYAYDGLLGWDIKADFQTEVFCGNKTFSSNSLGIRNTLYNDSSAQKSILFIGDSFVEGCEVSDQNTLSSLIAKDLKDIAIINAGVGGFGFDQIFLKLQEVLETFRPDVVVLGLASTDMNRVNLGFRDYYKPYFSIEAESLQLHQEHIVPPEQFMETYRKPGSLKNIIQYYKSKTNYKNDLLLSQRLIEAMRNYCISRTIPFYVYNIPSPGDFTNGQSFSNQKELFGTLCSLTQKETQFDPSDYLWSQSQTFTKKEGHWDSLGNYYLAQYFIDSIYPNENFLLK